MMMEKDMKVSELEGEQLDRCDECAGLAPTDNQEVTEAMIEDGRQIASDIMNANVSKHMNGLGGSQTWDEWLDAGVKNRDLAIAYVNGEIDSVTAIYKAMQRAKLMPNEQGKPPREAACKSDGG